MNICIVKVGGSPYSETFIRAAIEHLPASVYTTDKLPYLPVPAPEGGFGSAPEVAIFTLKKTLKRLVDQANERKFAQYIKREKIDVILAQFGQMGVLVMRLAQKTGTPLVVHFHGYDASKHEEIAKYGLLYREMFGIAKAVIVVSKAMEQAVVALGCPAQKVHRVMYGVEKSDLVRKIDPDFVQILGVGRFVEKKAPYLTLLAFAKAWEQAPRLRLTLVGDGPCLAMVQQMTKALGLEEVVSLPGAKSHAEVKALLLRSSMFVQHSLVASTGDSEGLPNSILEAMYLGVPVVSTYHAGIPDVITHGKSGLLGPEGDIEAMAANMLRLANDPALARELTRNAQAFANENFTMEHYISSLKRILAASLPA